MSRIHNLFQLVLRKNAVRTMAAFAFTFANACFAFAQNLDGLEEKDSITYNTIFFDGIDEVEPRPINLDEFMINVGSHDPDPEHFPDGTIKFKLEISAEGEIVSWENKSNFPLSETWFNAFDRALKILRFSPGMKNGVPVKCWVMLPLCLHPNK